MKHSLTIVYISSRYQPHYHDWFVPSLRNELVRYGKNQVKELIFVDSSPRVERLAENDLMPERGKEGFSRIAPKPNIWSCQYRVTNESWWSASNSRNSGICFCKTEWIAFLDDRSVLMPGWLDGISDAMERNTVFCGSYEKRRNMTVENGYIKHGGTIVAEDSRENYCITHKVPNPFPCPGSWTFGCSIALPLEWALAVNGFDETCDGLSQEDCVFGMMLQNAGYPIHYYKDAKMVEDRTPAECGPVMKRSDFGKSPVDKSHALNDRLLKLKRAEHYPNGWDLREVRKSVLSGNPWPIPAINPPPVDWYKHDGKEKLISEL